VTRLARRIYAAHQSHFRGSNPFDPKGPFAEFAHAKGLLAGKQRPQKATWQQFSGTDRRVAPVHTLLKLGLRVPGPNRYELLMRYLTRIARFRNQGSFLKPEPAAAGTARR